MAHIRFSVVAALALPASLLGAQDPTPGVDLPTDARSPLSVRSSGIVGIPVLRASPLLGFGLGGVGAVLFHTDSGSPRSSFGAGVFFAQRRSWMGSIGGIAHLGADQWRMIGGIAVFDLHYDFYGVGFDAGDAGQSVGVAQRGGADVFEALWRVAPGLHIGPRYHYRQILTRLEDPSASGPLADLAKVQTSYTTSALGIGAGYDTRGDDQTASSSGTVAHAALVFARPWIGSDLSYDRVDAWLNHYVPLQRDQVLAFRVVGCSVGADAPTWELCLLGVQSDLRGYAAGRYRDRTMLAGQGEYRIPIGSRVGVVAFAGAGEVASALSSFSMDHVLPSAGGGVRVLVSRTYGLRVGADYAFGRNGSAFYLRLGEAF